MRKSPEFKECKLLVQRCLESDPTIRPNSENYRCYVDEHVIRYLGETGKEQFLKQNHSGPSIGGISAGVLCDFVRKGTVFHGVNGDYQLRDSYGPNSARSFEPWPVK